MALLSVLTRVGLGWVGSVWRVAYCVAAVWMKAGQRVRDLCLTVFINLIWSTASEAG